MNSNLQHPRIALPSGLAAWGGSLLLWMAVASSERTCSAAILFMAGDHVLLPNQAGQTLTITANNQEGVPLAIDKFTLFAVVGDGGPSLGGTPAPVIGGAGGVDLHTGTPFDGNFTPEVNELFGSIGDDAIEVANWSVTTSGGSVNLPPGISTLATIAVDTTGFSLGEGPWNFRLSVNGVSCELSLGGTFFPVTFQNGSLSFAPIPEPQTLATCSGGVLLLGALIRLWSRRSRDC